MLYVEEDPETVLQPMSEGGYAKLTYLHQIHKTPVGPVWVNTARCVSSTSWAERASGGSARGLRHQESREPTQKSN